MTRILVTGFEPFARHAVNSSWEAARRLRGVEALRLPVDHAGAAEALTRAIGRTRPETVLLTGLADDTALRLETVARRPRGFEGPSLRAGRWPFARALGVMGHARLSNDAGAYVCETAYWTALGLAGPVRVVFLHVPPLGPVWTARRIAREMAACLRGAGHALPDPR